MAERKPGFIYIKSDLLKQEVAFSKKTGWLYCEDKYPDGSLVSYSPKELKLFEDAGLPIDLATHTIKKIFGGEIVGLHTGREGDNLVNTSKAGNSADIKEDARVVRDGELEIY